MLFNIKISFRNYNCHLLLREAGNEALRQLHRRDCFPASRLTHKASPAAHTEMPRCGGAADGSRSVHIKRVDFRLVSQRQSVASHINTN